MTSRKSLPVVLTSRVLILGLLLSTLAVTSTTLLPSAHAQSFPVIEATNSSSTTSDSTSHTVFLPEGIVSGDLIVVAFTRDGFGSIIFPGAVGDWNQSLQVACDASACNMAVYYRDADGTEGATITVSTSPDSEKSVHVAYRITGHDVANPPEGGGGAQGTTNLADPSSLTPTGGAKDYLWIAVEGNDRNRNVVSWPPFYGLSQINSAAGGATGAGVAMAGRNRNIATEDPPAFQISASDQWGAGTVAIHPAPGPPWTNTAPSIDQSFSTREGGHNITEEEAFTATDPDTNQTLVWTLATNGSFLGIEQDNRSAWVNGTPLFVDRDQSYFVNVTVGDEATTGNETDFLNYTLFVNNTLPVISDPIATDEGGHNISYSQDFDFTDANSDSGAWALESNASFLSVDGAGTVSGTPLFPDRDQSYFVNATVRDYFGGQGGVDFSNYTLFINNTLPVISNPISEDDGVNNTAYVRDFDFTDANSDSGSWDVDTDTPFTLSIDGAGTITGTPDTVGAFFVNATVRDYFGGQGGIDFVNYTLTISEPFILLTLAATNVTNNSAQLNGNLVSLGGLSEVNVSFEWGTSPDNLTAETFNVTFTMPGTFNVTLFNLTPNTVYYFRAKAVNGGENFGANRTFQTEALGLTTNDAITLVMLVFILALFLSGPLLNIPGLWILDGLVTILFGIFTFDVLAFPFYFAAAIMALGGILLISGSIYAFRAKIRTGEASS